MPYLTVKEVIEALNPDSMPKTEASRIIREIEQLLVTNKGYKKQRVEDDGNYTRLQIFIPTDEAALLKKLINNKYPISSYLRKAK